MISDSKNRMFFFFFSFFLKCAPQQMMGSVKQRSPVENLKTQPELK